MKSARRSVWRVGILVFLSAWSAVAAAGCGIPFDGTPSLAATGQADAVAVGVMDGDTFAAVIDGARRRVRLARIDAPEKKQAYGRRAEQALRTLIWARPLHLAWRALDRHCRPIAEVTVAGTNVSEAMVEQGMAWQYRTYSQDAALASLEAAARAAGRGLWADPRPVPPWEWRHGNGAQNGRASAQ